MRPGKKKEVLCNNFYTLKLLLNSILGKRNTHLKRKLINSLLINLKIFFIFPWLVAQNKIADDSKQLAFLLTKFNFCKTSLKSNFSNKF